MNQSRFDKYAKDYDYKVNSAIELSGESVDFFSKLKANLTRRYLRDVTPRSILDFGCGVGLSSRSLADAMPEAHVTGFDLSRKSIEVSRRQSEGKTSHISYLVSTGTNLPYADGKFDLAFASCVFHHMDQEKRSQSSFEIFRVLAPGSPFFLFEHNPYNPLTLRVVRNTPLDKGVTLLTPRYATKILRLAGFQVDRPRYYFFFPHLLRNLRPLERFLYKLPFGGQYFIVGWKNPDSHLV
jgi:ubiquinone/menaquinone biosynthesis C-methylase UbiE